MGRLRIGRLRIRRLHVRRPERLPQPVVAVIPSCLTIANGVCGFSSIIVASRIHPQVLLAGPAGAGWSEAMGYLGIAGWLIFLGMFFDVLDGGVARLGNVTSAFGAELDSLCDVISFGAAPAFLLLKMGPTAERPFLYKVLFVAATFYVICTILRLARFNLDTDEDVESHLVFTGLPSPAAAGCLAAVAIMRWDLQIYQDWIGDETLAFWTSTVLPWGALGVALLMVSNVEYPHFVNSMLRGRKPFGHLVQLLLLVIVVVLFRELALVLALWGFAAYGLLRWAWRPLTERVPVNSHPDDNRPDDD